MGIVGKILKVVDVVVDVLDFLVSAIKAIKVEKAKSPIEIQLANKLNLIAKHLLFSNNDIDKKFFTRYPDIFKSHFFNIIYNQAIKIPFKIFEFPNRI